MESAVHGSEKNGNGFTVVVRLRPNNSTEDDGPYKEIVKRVDDHLLVFDPKASSPDIFDRSIGHGLGNGGAGLREKRTRNMRFAFDFVFGKDATQAHIFQMTGAPIISHVLDGFNATIFAYGATGAGKTYTMLGNESSGPGVMVLTLNELFARAESDTEWNHSFTVTLMEIYNEQIRDLLVPQPHASVPPAGSSRKPNDGLALRHDPVFGPVVQGITAVSVETAEEAVALLFRGASSRSCASTAENERSSRSHCVFQIRVLSRKRGTGTDSIVRHSKLSLVDLAGSERASRTRNEGQRLREGASINRSLLALGNCINALCRANGKRTYVPYRESKLTRLLQDSLGGNCKTVMISNISASSRAYEDTLNTLTYANRARSIRTGELRRNEREVRLGIDKYEEIVSSLKKEVAELRQQLGIASAQRDEAWEQLSRKEEAASAQLQLDADAKAHVLMGDETAQRLKQDLAQALSRQCSMRRHASRVRYTLQRDTTQLLGVETVLRAWLSQFSDIVLPPVEALGDPAAQVDWGMILPENSQVDAVALARLAESLREKIRTLTADALGAEADIRSLGSELSDMLCTANEQLAQPYRDMIEYYYRFWAAKIDCLAASELQEHTAMVNDVYHNGMKSRLLAAMRLPALVVRLREEMQPLTQEAETLFSQVTQAISQATAPPHVAALGTLSRSNVSRDALAIMAAQNGLTQGQIQAFVGSAVGRDLSVHLPDLIRTPQGAFSINAASLPVMPSPTLSAGQSRPHTDTTVPTTPSARMELDIQLSPQAEPAQALLPHRQFTPSARARIESAQMTARLEQLESDYKTLLTPSKKNPSDPDAI